MNKETIYWKCAWDTFHLQVFDYEDDVKRMHAWIKKQRYGVKNILEVGCGAGRYLKLLKDSGYRCTGIDNDSDILKYARKTVLKKDKNVSLIKADALQEIPVNLENKFDLVIGKHLSFPLDDLRKVLDYTRKSLNSKGPKLVVFDFLIAEANKLEKNILSIDSAIREDLFLIRMNQMELKKVSREYRWEETYIIKEVKSDLMIKKANYRSLWFISFDELERLLRQKEIKIEGESEEVTGINNLKGVTIYGSFQR